MKKKVVIGLNISIIIFEIIGFIYAILEGGIQMVKYYTEDSNFMLLIASSIYLYYMLKKKEIPSWLSILKYMATVSVLLTFVVVLTILPWNGNTSLITLLTHDAMLYHHTLCPILGVISFIFFERYNFSSKKQVIESLYFTFIYGIIITILNILKIVEGPYPFLMVYKQPVYMSIIWYIVIFVMCYLLSLSIKTLNKKFNKK